MNGKELTAARSNAAEGKTSDCPEINMSRKRSAQSVLTAGRNDRLVGDRRTALCVVEDWTIVGTKSQKRAFNEPLFLYASFCENT